MSRKFLIAIATIAIVFVGFAATTASAGTASPGQYPPTTDGSQVGNNAGNQGGTGGTGGAGTGTNNGAPLPRTGSDPRPFVAIGLVLIGAGAFALVAASRRREPSTT